MNCPEKPTIDLLLDGELSPDGATATRSHLETCADCRAYHDEGAELLAMFRSQNPNVTIEEARFWRAFDAELALRVARGETPFWRRSFVIPFPVAAAASALVLVLMVLAIQDRMQMGHLTVRATHLEAALKDLESRSFFAVALPPQDATDVAGGGAMAMPTATPLMYAQPVMMRSAARPMATPQPQIRFIDSTVVQPGDLY